MLFICPIWLSKVLGGHAEVTSNPAEGSSGCAVCRGRRWPYEYLKCHYYAQFVFLDAQINQAEVHLSHPVASFSRADASFSHPDASVCYPHASFSQTEAPSGYLKAPSGYLIAPRSYMEAPSDPPKVPDKR